MPPDGEFSFGDNSIAASYDAFLVPVLFDPWASRLVEEHGPWRDRHVLDLATGTGIVAEHLLKEVGPGGRVIAADINAEMLAQARKRCGDGASNIEFIESPAHPLQVSSRSIDIVVCQQGFQFFPDRTAAAREIHRVLRPGGTCVATTWLPVSECQFFGAICDALISTGEPDIADLMRVPFDHMPGSELLESFTSAGFADASLCRQEQDLHLTGGVERAIEMAYSTPIGPRLRALSEEKQGGFCGALTRGLREICNGDASMGRMATHVLTASRAR